MLDHNYFESIVKAIRKSINLHESSLDLFTDCNCNTPEQIGKCFNCRTKNQIESLKEIKSNLYLISNPSISFPQFVDAEAFRYALLQSGQFNNVRCFPTFNDPIAEQNYQFPKDANGFTIESTIERFAMDGNGFHVGYESVTFQWNCIDKHELGITGIPYILSKWVVNPDQFEIVEKDYPEEDEPIHDDDCELNSEPDGECDCGAFESLYYPPDDDFWYQQLDSILDSIKYPIAQFDADTRTWQLGDLRYDMNRFQDDVYYQNQLNENDGAPLID